MIRIREGIVIKLLLQYSGVTEALVRVEGKEETAVNYDFMTGPLNVGDHIALNTTAIHKGLGSGGFHFVMANLSNLTVDTPEKGHIMKLRYTPAQVKCLAVEEEDSPFRGRIEDFGSLMKTPVVIGTIHSMLPAIVCGIKAGGQKIRVVYVMTDGAALPLPMSRLAAKLKKLGLIDATVTVGNAFGGDYEAVNIYTGLIAAKRVAEADVVVVTMGPGIVGTGTTYGFSGVEQGEIINAVNILEGRPIAVPRISFADPRERHTGISHHTLTVLTKIALTRAAVVLPKTDKVKEHFINTQILKHGVKGLHDIVVEDGEPALKFMAEKGIKVTTMGRQVDEDREYFLAAGAAGIFAGRYIIC
jgi:hypothetical protein